jgi:hypothetical protein
MVGRVSDRSSGRHHGAWSGPSAPAASTTPSSRAADALAVEYAERHADGEIT